MAQGRIARLRSLVGIQINVSEAAKTPALRR